MRNLTKENLIKFLVKHGACKPGLDWAQSQVSARDIIEKCPEGQYLDWLIVAIGGPMDAEYGEKIDPILAEYEEKEAPIWAEYKEKEAPFRAEYDKKVAPFRAEYLEKCYNLTKEICTFERVQAEIGT